MTNGSAATGFTPSLLPHRDEYAPSVVLSYGMGLDSSALLLRWLSDPTSRDFDLHEMVVVTAMTGNEFSSTASAVTRHILPRLRQHGVRFIQVARSQRKTTAAGNGVAVLDDSDTPERLHTDGLYTLGEELLEAGTVPSSAESGPAPCTPKATAWIR